jgi:translation initiation factor 3 subunit M
MYLPRICNALTQPITSSPQHGPSLALSILTTVFNTLPPSNSSRYHVLLAILGVLRSAPTSPPSLNAFEALKPTLSSSLPAWLASWDVDEEAAQKLHLAISSLASEAGDRNLSYTHLLHALDTIPPSDSATSEARALATRTLITALTLPSIYDFTPLTALDSIQSLRRSDPILFELLEIFAADTLDTYEEFLSQSPNPLSTIPALSSPAVAETLQTKIRLLTLSSLAASTPSRSLPYSAIASALRIPPSDVEKWVIDTIRAGLIEGKLSQLKSEFLVQRATYRVFGEKQWSEVQGRLMVWRRSLEGVLGVVRAERERMARERASGGKGENGYGEDSGERQGQRRRGGGGGGGDREGRERGGRREVEFVGGD